MSNKQISVQGSLNTTNPIAYGDFEDQTVGKAPTLSIGVAPTKSTRSGDISTKPVQPVASDDIIQASFNEQQKQEDQQIDVALEQPDWMGAERVPTEVVKEDKAEIANWTKVYNRTYEKVPWDFTAGEKAGAKAKQTNQVSFEKDKETWKGEDSYFDIRYINTARSFHSGRELQHIQ